ncbi:AIM24 family protein [Schaalia sp. 19OD2882]|nr:AIM24 family protein [Schaalia sp. 19OD2882]
MDLDNDELRIDGPLAVMWSPGLQFTVERSGRSLLGSMASGEGLVNVFRGSGRVVLSPVAVTNLTPPVVTTA